MKKLKNTLYGISALACTFAMSGCTADDLSAGGGNTLIEVTTQPSASGEAESRTAIDPTDYTSGQIGINWLPTDRIGVYGSNGTANAPFGNQNTAESDKATFAGTLASGESPLYAYSPYTSTAGTDPAAVKGTLGGTQRYNSATRQLEGDWKAGTPQAGNSGKFRFKNIFPFLRFAVNATGTDVASEQLLSVSLQIEGARLHGDFTCDLTRGGATTCTPASDAAKVVMEWSDKPQLAGGSTVYGYMSCFPAAGLQGKTATVTVTTDKHIATFTATMKADALEANYYYTVPLSLALYADSWTLEENPDGKEENAAWVSGLQSRLACANTVYAIAGQPFMHKIRVPDNPSFTTSATSIAALPVKTGVQRAYNLPEGLTWNAERCLVQGTAPAAGDYVYSVEFTVDGTTYQEGIKLHVAAAADELLSPTPMMGWQTWNVLKAGISYDILASQLAGMKDKGLIDAGYKYFGIDDCWQVQNENDNGHQIPDASKFPSADGVNGMKRMADLIHNYGLKAGIYTDCGTKTCEQYFASYGYEELHAQDYQEWGYDFVKEDWYYSTDMAPTGATSSNFTDGYAGLHTEWNSPSKAHELYTKMGQALKNRGLMLYMCEWGVHEPWKWGAETGATCWRMSYDGRDGWWGKVGSSKNSDQNANGVGLHNTIVLMRNLWPYVGINRYNDADMICVGIRGTGQSSNDCVYVEFSLSNPTRKNPGLTSTEAETSFVMWCMWSSPILLGFDMTKDMTSTDLAHDLALVKNEELIAINQDPLGQGAEYIKSADGIDYYQKDLANGDVAIAAVNLSDNSANYTISLSDYAALDKDASYSARDLIGQKDAGTLSVSSSLTGTIAAHGTFVVRLTRNN